jgi:hypothetical protein
VRKIVLEKLHKSKKNEKIRVDFSRERLETWCKVQQKRETIPNKMEADKLFKSLSAFTSLQVV